MINSHLSKHAKTEAEAKDDELKTEAEPFFIWFTVHTEIPARGRDFQVERSVARLNLKCQMFHFDLMEEKNRPHTSKHFTLFTLKTDTDQLFHRAVA